MLCKGYTVSGNKCKKTIKKGDFCHWHFLDFVQEKLDECPICMESLEKEKQPLSCGHWIHKKCVVQSAKAECPMCRKTVQLTKGETKKVTSLARVRRQEQIEEDEEELRNNLHHNIEILLTPNINEIIQELIGGIFDSEDYTIDVVNGYFLRTLLMRLTFRAAFLALFFALSFGVWTGIVLPSYC